MKAKKPEKTEKTEKPEKPEKESNGSERKSFLSFRKKTPSPSRESDSVVITASRGSDSPLSLQTTSTTSTSSSSPNSATSNTSISSASSSSAVSSSGDKRASEPSTEHQKITDSSKVQIKKTEDVKKRRKKKKEYSNSFDSKNNIEDENDESKKKKEQKEQRKTAPGSMQHTQGSNKNPSNATQATHNTFFQSVSNYFFHKKSPQVEQEAKATGVAETRSAIGAYNPDSKNSRPPYTFRAKDLCLLSEFIQSVFKEISPLAEDVPLAASSPIIKTVLELNEGCAEFSYSILLSNSINDAFIERETRKLDLSKKDILFILTEKTKENEKTKEIVAYISDPQWNSVAKLKTANIDVGSPFFKVLESVFASRNPQSVDVAELKGLLLNQSLYPGHVPVIKTIARHFEVLAFCRSTKSTLNLSVNDFKIGNPTENLRSIGIFGDIESSILAPAGQFIEAHKKEILNCIRNKNRLVSYTKSYTSDTETFESIKVNWVTSSKRGDVLFVYDVNEQIWKVCCNDESGVLQRNIGPDIFNYVKEAKEVKNDRGEDENPETDNESSSESEKLLCEQLGSEDLTDSRIYEILNMIELNKFFIPMQVNKDIEPEKEAKSKAEDVVVETPDLKKSTVEEKSQPIDPQLKVFAIPESEKLGDNKGYLAVAGVKRLPKRYALKRIVFCESYFKIFIDKGKENSENLKKVEKLKASNIRKSNFFEEPPAGYVNPNPSRQVHNITSSETSKPVP